MDSSGAEDSRHSSGCEEPRRSPGGFVVRLLWAPGQLAVVAVAGEVDYHTSTCLRDVVQTALDAGAVSMLIDLTEVTFLDAGGLGVTVVAARSLGSTHTIVVCPDQRLVRIFRVTALDRALIICDNRREALDKLVQTGASVPPALSLDDTELSALPEAG